MNRIKINGEWYIKESVYHIMRNIDEYPQEFNILSYEVLEIDADGFRLEGVKLKIKEDKYTTYITVDNKGNTSEHWDNESFLKGLADDSEESWDEISDLSSDVFNGVYYLVKEMRNKGWI